MNSRNSYMRSPRTVVAALMFLAGVCGCTGSAASGASAGTSMRTTAAHAASPRAETATESAVPEGWPWRGVTVVNDGGVSPADLDKLVNELGINSVHLYPHIAHNARVKKEKPQQAWQNGLTWLDEMLAECKKDNIVAVVHLRGFIDNSSGGFFDQTTPGFWNNPAAVDQIYKQVSELAEHLHHYGSELGAYDILSEPVMRSSSGPVQPPNWERIQARIVETIRSKDPGRWVVVKPGPWGGTIGYREFTPLSYPNLIYSVHVYRPHQYTHQGTRNLPLGVKYPGTIRGRSFDKAALERLLRPVIRFQKRYKVPVYVGEFGVHRWAPGATQYITDLANIFDSHGWGWAYFSMGGYQSWDLRYDSSYTPTASSTSGHMVMEKSPMWQTLSKILHGGAGQ